MKQINIYQYFTVRSDKTEFKFHIPIDPDHVFKITDTKIENNEIILSGITGITHNLIIITCSHVGRCTCHGVTNKS